MFAFLSNALFWFYLLLAAFVFVCVIMILLILIQKGKGGGLSGAFGGTSGNTAFGTKTGDVLTWATSIVFGVFLLLAVGLNRLADAVGTAHSTTTAAPTATAAPGPANPAPAQQPIPSSPPIGQ